MKPKIKLFLFSVVLLISCKSFSQANTDSLFTDFDLSTFKPVAAAIPQQLEAGRKYIRNLHSKSAGKQKIQIIKVYGDTTSDARKASIVHTGYGTVIAFDVLKTPGYEKVLIFADWDYYYDSLLIKSDTLYFKQKSDNAVSLLVVYPVKNDTLTIQYGSRNIRYDFLKKFIFRHAMKNYSNWFPDDKLDYTAIYTFVKKGVGYEMIKSETSEENISAYDYKSMKERYFNAGLSPFRIALSALAF